MGLNSDLEGFDSALEGFNQDCSVKAHKLWEV